jgi:AcrR family transcriptional regulator
VNIRRIVTLSGPSESGKSHAAEFFIRNGFLRLKIRDVLKAVGRELGVDTTREGFEDALYGALWTVAAESFITHLKKLQAEGDSLVLDSLVRVQTAAALSAAFGPCVTHVYIDAPLALRAAREHLRLKSPLMPGQFMELVRQKDIEKNRRGLQSVYESADLVIDNSGSIAVFEDRLSLLIHSLGAPPIDLVGPNDRPRS